eukprot:CAMPEP_0167814560 /NCGR_PEP_ID=MMETSP0112_2-20121227/2492_1 /TAXON_ID=91324 /ORGANISM="Lotharella globosa, Strain CCCM811" /LENGTH=48 /DNA_ID= /DNA_START= /DNA_END= /DNA_ORIENTATION=
MVDPDVFDREEGAIKPRKIRVLGYTGRLTPVTVSIMLAIIAVWVPTTM